MSVLDADGRLYHLGLRPGEASNLVITVGDHGRAEQIALMFEQRLFRHCSSRGFLTITGTYKSTVISIIAIGMGAPNMDFFVRELRAILREGPLNVIRVGTCGSIRRVADSNDGDGDSNDDDLGRIALCSGGSAIIQRNFNYFSPSPSQSPPSQSPSSLMQQSNASGSSLGESGPYLISPVFPSDPDLDKAILEAAASGISLIAVKNASADSFYSSQGRQSLQFADHNQGMVEELQERHFDTLEMETGMLFHLAGCAVVQNVHASAIQIVVADRSPVAF